MTRARAIELLKGVQFCCDLDDCTNAWDCDECVEALYMAIEALEQEPCDDCISKTLALEILNAMANVDKDNIKVYSKVYSQIKDIPSVTQRCEKWIPVTERLPEIGDTVIISGKMKYKGDKDYEEFVDVAIFEVTQRFETFNDWYEGQDEFEIVAWQPLPEPYEETEQ